jgi:hypothetical protein
MAGIPNTLPSGLVELLRQRLEIFAAQSERHQHHIARMLWDYANNRYQHAQHSGAAFSVDYMKALWGNLRTRNRVVRQFFSNIQGDNISHLYSSFTPYDFLGEVLVEYLEDESPINLLDGNKRLRMPQSPILSRAASDNPEVVHAKHAKWKGLKPSRVLPIHQQALWAFSRTTPDARQRMCALRLLKLSRNTLSPGSIPLLYEQKSTGRLTEVLFAIQNTPREVLSAALHGHWDYDLQNAHFSLLSGWANKLGQSTPVVDSHLQNKTLLRQELAAHCQADLDDIKGCLIALLYGAPLNTHPDFARIPKILGRQAAQRFTKHPFVQSLKKEINVVGQVIVADTYSPRGCYVNAMGIEAAPGNSTFGLLCHALQGLEALILKAVVSQYGEDILLCMHDGWVSRRRLNLNELEHLIEKTTGLRLQVEEQLQPKYRPELGEIQPWAFTSSAPIKPGLILSASSQWNVPKPLSGRIIRTDVLFKKNS